VSSQIHIIFKKTFSLTYQVYEGENPYVKENRSLGVFILNGLPQRERGKVQIEVTFMIDANGILEVAAQLIDQESTGVSHSITIDQNKVGNIKCYLYHLLTAFLSLGSPDSRTNRRHDRKGSGKLRQSVLYLIWFINAYSVQAFEEVDKTNLERITALNALEQLSTC